MFNASVFIAGSAHANNSIWRSPLIVLFNRLQFTRRAARALRAAALALMLFTPFMIPTSTLAAGPDRGISLRLIAADELPNAPGRKLTALMVDLAPGAKSPKHHHAGFVFVYVLSGTIRSQLNGGQVKDYAAGQSWVEPPGTEHTLTENPSRSTRASLLAVFVAPKGAQLTTYNK
jgi:quercetin dioxygenase-like cupin family protein